jgi:hypothetical protein
MGPVTADLLTDYETCDRKGFWSQAYRRKRLDATTMVRKAIAAGVTSDSREWTWGEIAGQTIMDLAESPGMETPASHHLYESVIHHAALADILTTAIRKPLEHPWTVRPPETVAGAPWASSAFLDPSGLRLRRVLPVSTWTDERHYSSIRSWYGLGEVAAYGLPMTQVVLVLGSHRDGRRSGPWTKGFLHPQNHKLRFRKKSRSSSEVFSDRWEQVWREHRDEIDTRTWLQAMLDDDVLRDVCFTVDIPVPSAPERKRICEMAAQKMERLKRITLPEASMSVCDRPACPFKGCCWSWPEYAPDKSSVFISISHP